MAASTSRRPINWSQAQWITSSAISARRLRTVPQILLRLELHLLIVPLQLPTWSLNAVETQLVCQIAAESASAQIQFLPPAYRASLLRSTLQRMSRPTAVTSRRHGGTPI